MGKNGGIQYPDTLKAILKRALEDTEGFWGEAARELNWFRPWDRVFEWNYPRFRWFINGKTNISYNCLDYQVIKRGMGDKTAIIWESGENACTKALTYAQLLDKVERFAGALRASGLKKGDRATIYMPMVPEAAIAMLAVTRLGAVHSVVFGGFGASALADRITDAGSKIVITSDAGYRRGKPVNLKTVVDEALKSQTSVEKVIVLKRGEADPPMLTGRDLYWEEALEGGGGETAGAVQTSAGDLAFILYTSGTMAKPKGTVQPHGSYQVYIHAMARWVYGMKPEDMWWSTSDIGWIVGHSYVVYAPLLIGCTTIMYEGTPDYPDPGIWWRVIERNRVSKVWLSPTGVRALMKFGDEWPSKYDLSSVKLVVCAGEVLNPPAWEWLHKKAFKGVVPVIDHMWQTESSAPIVGLPYGIAMLPVKPGSAGIPLPGIEGDVVDNEGKSLPPGVKGIFVCRRPFPGLTASLWKAEDRYVESYWSRIPGCYYTGDAAFKDEDGYIWFLGRADEVIKIAGHRVGTIEIESVLLTHPRVAEAAVVGKPDDLRGEVAVGFVVLKPGSQPSGQLKDELVALVRKEMGAIVVIGDITFVSMLPKTRSGKIMRRLIKALVTRQDLGDYSTIEDEASVEEIRKAVELFRASIAR